MNCLYITLFFNIVAGTVQTFIKSWNQLLYPRVIEVYRQHFEPRHDFFLYLSEHQSFLRRIHGTTSSHYADSYRYHKQQQFVCVFPLDVHSLALRNRMTERTSHLARLWIGAAVSNTSHSNKAGSTTVKRTRHTGKGSRSTAVLS